MVTRRSAKQKGRRFQAEIAKELQEHFSMEEMDFMSTPSSVTGEDILMSDRAKKAFPYCCELKNQETWSIPQWWKQTLANTEEGRKPLLVIKKNHMEPLVVLRWSDFKDLL